MVTYEDVVTAPAKVGVVLAPGKETRSGEAVFPAQGQRATSENDVTATDGAGCL